MAQLVIVTKHCYLICEGINHISVNELSMEEKRNYGIFSEPRKPKKGKGKRKVEPDSVYQVTIDFIPVPHNNPANQHSRSDGSRNVVITLKGYQRTMELFEAIVSQIREQMPDQLYLNKLVEKFFTQNPEEK